MTSRLEKQQAARGEDRQSTVELWIPGGGLLGTGELQF